MFVLMFFVFAAPIAPRPFATTINVSQADNIERRLTDSAYRPTEFYASFTTDYKINNRGVKAQEFWSKNLLGKNIQIKASIRSGVWFVSRLNLLEPK